MGGFEAAYQDDANARVLARLRSEIGKTLEEPVIGRPLTVPVDAWNVAPLQRRKEIAAWLLRLPVPGDEVKNVRFVWEHGEVGDPNVGITVKLEMAEPVEVVSVTVTVGEPERTGSPPTDREGTT